MGTLSPWLARRLRGITGTDVAAILGVHPYRSALQVWAEKTGRAQPDDLSEREDVYWGTRLEGIVLAEYERRTGRRLLFAPEWATEGVELLRLPHDDGPKEMLARVEHPWLLCTPDGVADAWKPLPWLEEQVALEGLGMVEAKTGSAYVAHNWNEGAPIAYQVQAGYNAAVAGLKWFSLTGLLGGQKHLTYDYELAPKTAAHLINAATKFWHDHVLADVEPPTRGAVDLEPWKRLHPRDDGTTVELDPLAWQASDEHLQQLKSTRKECDAEIKDIEARLKGAIGDATTARIEGVAQYTLKTQDRAERVVAATSFRTLRRKKL